MKKAKNTELKNDARELFLGLFGTEATKQIDNFEDPIKYPKDFLDECNFFMAKMIGEYAAKRKMQPLYRRYLKINSNKNKKVIK